MLFTPMSVEMLIEETARGAPAVVAQHFEEIVVVGELAGRVKALPSLSSTMRCTLMRRYWPGPMPRGSRP